MKKHLIELALCLCCLITFVGCAANSGASGEASATNNGSGTASAAPKIVVGTLATEDILPCWVAQEEGLFANENLDAEVAVFQSASELIAAVSSGSVDFAMTDPMVTASLYA